MESIFCALNLTQEKFYFFDSDRSFLEDKAFYENLILSNFRDSLGGSMFRYKDILYVIDHVFGTLFKFLE